MCALFVIYRAMLYGERWRLFVFVCVMCLNLIVCSVCELLYGVVWYGVCAVLCQCAV